MHPRTLTLAITLAVSTLSLTGCSVFTPQAAPTVTVTATPSNSYMHTAETVPELSDDVSPETFTAPPRAETPDSAPTLAETAAPPTDTGDDAQGVSIIASEGMEGDDYIIRLRTNSGATATMNYAPSVLADKVNSLTGTPQAKTIDLVAVYTADGMMIGTARLPDGKYAGVTSGL